MEFDKIKHFFHCITMKTRIYFGGGGGGGAEGIHLITKIL